MISVIAAVSDNGIVGYKNRIPWSKDQVPRDLPHFMRQTTRGIIIKGRNTAESMGFVPLKNRINVIVSKTLGSKEGFIILPSFTEALHFAIDEAVGKENFPISAIGGYKIWEEALESGHVDRALITRVHNEFEGDTFFPEKILEENFHIFYKDKWVEKDEGKLNATFEVWKKR